MSDDVRITVRAKDLATQVLETINQKFADLTKTVGDITSALTKLANIEGKLDALTSQLGALGNNIAGIGSKVGSDVADIASKVNVMGGAMKAAAIATGLLAAGFVAIKGIGKAFEFFGGAISDFNAATEAVNSLDRAMRLNGDGSKELLESHAQVAEQIEKTTNIEAERVLGLMRNASMMGVSSDKLDDMATAAIGLSNAMGIDLDDAMKKVRLAQEGHFESFNKLIPSLKDMATNEEKLAAVMKLSEKGFIDQQAVADSAAQSGARLSNSLGNLMESIGGLLSPFQQLAAQGVTYLADAITQTIQPAIQRMMDGIASMQPIMEAIGGAFQKLGVVAGVYIEMVASNFSSLIGGFVGADTTVQGVADGINGAIQWLSESLIAAFTYTEIVVANFGQVWELMKASVELNVIATGEAIKYTFTTVIPAYLDWFASNWLNILTDAFNATTTLFSNVGQKIFGVLQAVFVRVGELGQWFGRNWQSIFTDAFNMAVTIVQNRGQQIVDLFSAVWDRITQRIDSSEMANRMNEALGRDMLAGFEATTQEMPQLSAGLGEEISNALAGGLLNGFEAQTTALPGIAARQLTDKEKEIGDKIATIGGDLANKFSDKYNDRIKRLADEQKDLFKPKAELAMELDTQPIDENSKKKAKVAVETQLSAVESRLLTRGEQQGPLNDISNNTKETVAAVKGLQDLWKQKDQQPKQTIELVEVA